ncbi:MAG: hypothetical protein GX956_05830 [Firmicutes bacterium]|nr:hypothetical protein [Bacillota bacterium]
MIGRGVTSSQASDVKLIGACNTVLLFDGTWLEELKVGYLDVLGTWNEVNRSARVPAPVIFI